MSTVATGSTQEMIDADAAPTSLIPAKNVVSANAVEMSPRAPAHHHPAGRKSNVGPPETTQSRV